MSEEAVEPRTPAEIEADLAATRARLAGNVDALAETVSPQALGERAAEGVKGFFVDEHGVRTTNVAKAAAAVAALVAFRTIVRKLN